MLIEIIKYVCTIAEFSYLTHFKWDLKIYMELNGLSEENSEKDATIR